MHRFRPGPLHYEDRCRTCGLWKYQDPEGFRMIHFPWWAIWRE
jgi:hypothetical protein